MAWKGTWSVLVAALAIAGCGGSDSDNDDGGGTSDRPAQQSSPAAACVGSWNVSNKDVRAQASLTHRGDTPKDVHVGTYAGAAFTGTGESYDPSGSTSSAEVSVGPGDCVAVDRTGSGDSDTNWVMVAPKATGDGKAWYFLDETGSHPLAKSPQPLTGERVVRIQGLGQDAKLTP